MNKTNLFAFLCTVAFTQAAYSQVGINMTNAPADASAMLDVESSSKGVLLTPMLGASRNNISNPATGLTVYITDDATYPHGYYYYNGSAWVRLSDTATGTVTTVTATSPLTSSGGTSPNMSFNSQNANTVLASPNGSAGAPAFRSMVAADIPNLDASKITSGVLPAALGGTGATNLTGYIIGNGTGAFTATSTLPSSTISSTVATLAANGTSIASTTQISSDFAKVTISDGLNIAVRLPSAIIGKRVYVDNISTNAWPLIVFPAVTGGTINGMSASAAWSIPIGTSMEFLAIASGGSTDIWVPSNEISPVNGVASASKVLSTGINGIPQWSSAGNSGNQIFYSNNSGLPTWLAPPGANQFLYGNGSGVPTWLTAPTANQFLCANGSGVPSWLTAPGAFQFLYSNGSSVPGWLAAPGVNQLLYSNGSSVPGWLTSGANSSVLTMNGSGVMGFTPVGSNAFLSFNGSGTPSVTTLPLAITNGGTGTPGVSQIFSSNNSSVASWFTVGSNAFLSFNGSGAQVATALPLTVSNGGTGASALTGYIKGNGAGAFTASATIPTSDLSGSYSATSISGIVPSASGGTGTSSSGTQYGIPYYTLTNKMASTLAGTTTTVLHGNNIGAPTFSAVSLTADVLGTLPVANGGTGAIALTGIVKGTGSTALTAATQGTDYSVGTSGLATGLLKSTTGTGNLSIATASDLPSGSSSYINNTTISQASANFNISGTGAIGNGASNSFMFDVEGGTSSSGVAGKGIQLVAQSGNSSLAGAITIKAGNGSSSAGGAVSIISGNGSSSSGGNINFTPGTGTTNGAVVVTQGVFRVSSSANGAITVGTCSTPAATVTVDGTIQATGAITSSLTACGSDIRWKRNIIPLSNSLDNILKLNGYYYYWKTNEFPDNNFSDDRQVGVIAQEVEKIYPELVITNKTSGYKYVDYAHLTAVFIEAIKEQQKMIDDLKASNNELKASTEKTKDIEKRFDALQTQLSELSNYIRQNPSFTKEKVEASSAQVK